MNTFTVTIHLKDKILTKAVEKDSFTIGRSLDCDIPLNETLVSRVHVVVSRRWNQIWIEDKNSSNGTF
ncbi:MAG TPA: FHA domain-containing protein, partial [Bdellovibrio sp.]|nr:FHA domain-containing protein [Bdellovibrio sp.]